MNAFSTQIKTHTTMPINLLAALFLQTVKMGVQYSLWGGSVMNLGTERHKKQYFDAMDKFKIPGRYIFVWLLCFFQLLQTETFRMQCIRRCNGNVEIFLLLHRLLLHDRARAWEQCCSPTDRMYT